MREKSFIILGKTNKGKYIGYTENSFDMGKERYWVRVWRITKKNNENNNYIKWLQKETRELNKMHPTIKWDLYRVGSKKCPVKINWHNYHYSENGKNLKYSYRNLNFMEK